MNRKTIIATIGPSSSSQNVIRKMDKSGVDIFRINLSHTKSNDFEGIYNRINKWTSKPICIDTEGAQLRTSIIGEEDKELLTKPYDVIEFVGSKTLPTNTQIQLNLPSPENILYVGDLLKIDFDGILVRINNIQDNIIYATVINGGLVRKNKGISVDRIIDMPSFTPKDIEVFRIANRLKINIIFFSFCSSGNSVQSLRNFFDYDINIISKIESQTALISLEDICIQSDGILIDRGDLSRDVAIEKIAFAQSFILEKACLSSTPVYVATNFLESMIEKPNPTRAEINDIVSTLNAGGEGIVLAAETAIGKYPVECVRIINRIIKEFENPNYFSSFKNKKGYVNYLMSISMDGIIKPHGAEELVQQIILDSNCIKYKGIPKIYISKKIISDVVQIAEGVYTPVKGFMNLDQMQSVLNNNTLNDGTYWTLPVLFQINEKRGKKIPNKDQLLLVDELDEPIGIINIRSIEKIVDMESISKIWFGTNDKAHPGVKSFFNEGNYIISGDTYLFNNYRTNNRMSHELSPKQTRGIFYHNNWRNVVGFHTRNIPHRGHEYIQRKALELSDCDAILISPVTGIKKSGDFTSNSIISCYKSLIQSGVYKPYGSLLSRFNTYSRYSGPREAVFTAICRKNFGCNYFIVGRDHTGVGNYYHHSSSKNIFDNVDLDITILPFDTVSYCNKRKQITDDFIDSIYSNSRIPLSGTAIRSLLVENQDVPEYMMSANVIKIIKELYNISPHQLIID